MAAPLDDTEIREMVDRSCLDYTFRERRKSGWRRIRKSGLIRVSNDDGKVDRLRNGIWIPSVRRPAYKNSDLWEECDAKRLRVKVRRHAWPDLDDDRAGWHPREWRTRIELGLPWRWLIPPLEEGSARRQDKEHVARARAAYVGKVWRLSGEDLEEVKAQISDGYQRALNRIALFEQRAGIFLGASALTSSLVLGNASLLLGTGKLEAPYLQLAAVALGIAGLSSIAAAFRALQVTMFTFGRYTPTNSAVVAERTSLRGDALTRSYVGALFIAAARADSIANWKGDQLRIARRWILTTTAGVVALTIVVLIDAL